jgi:hypothetical protein
MCRRVGISGSALRRKVVGIAGIAGIVGITPRRGGEIGRRARLRIWSLTGCGFESRPRHNILLNKQLRELSFRSHALAFSLTAIILPLFFWQWIENLLDVLFLDRASLQGILSSLQTFLHMAQKTR